MLPNRGPAARAGPVTKVYAQWALGLREIGMTGFWAMVVFLAVLLIGWGYAWRRGDLTWAR